MTLCACLRVSARMYVYLRVCACVCVRVCACVCVCVSLSLSLCLSLSLFLSFFFLISLNKFASAFMAFFYSLRICVGVCVSFPASYCIPVFFMIRIPLSFTREEHNCIRPMNLGAYSRYWRYLQQWKQRKSWTMLDTLYWKDLSDWTLKTRLWNKNSNGDKILDCAGKAGSGCDVCQFLLMRF